MKLILLTLIVFGQTIFAADLTARFKDYEQRLITAERLKGLAGAAAVLANANVADVSPKSDPQLNKISWAKIREFQMRGNGAELLADLVEAAEKEAPNSSIKIALKTIAEELRMHWVGGSHEADYWIAQCQQMQAQHSRIANRLAELAQVADQEVPSQFYSEMVELFLSEPPEQVSAAYQQILFVDLGKLETALDDATVKLAKTVKDTNLGQDLLVTLKEQIETTELDLRGRKAALEADLAQAKEELDRVKDRTSSQIQTAKDDAEKILSEAREQEAVLRRRKEAFQRSITAFENAIPKTGQIEVNVSPFDWVTMPTPLYSTFKARVQEQIMGLIQQMRSRVTGPLSDHVFKPSFKIQLTLRKVERTRRSLLFFQYGRTVLGFTADARLDVEMTNGPFRSRLSKNLRIKFKAAEAPSVSVFSKTAAERDGIESFFANKVAKDFLVTVKASTEYPTYADIVSLIRSELKGVACAEDLSAETAPASESGGAIGSGGIKIYW